MTGGNLARLLLVLRVLLAIWAGAGDDEIISGLGNDTIEAGEGRNVINLRGDVLISPLPNPDLVIEDGGFDTVRSGSGDDLFILSAQGTAKIFGYGANGRIDVNGSLNAAATVSIQVFSPEIVGTPGPDLLIGTAQNDPIRGLGGRDRLIGLGGNDTMQGDGGADVLLGGDGNDFLLGDSDDPRIRGGNDRIKGGAGDLLILLSG